MLISVQDTGGHVVIVHAKDIVSVAEVNTEESVLEISLINSKTFQVSEFTIEEFSQLLAKYYNYAEEDSDLPDDNSESIANSPSDTGVLTAEEFEILKNPAYKAVNRYSYLGKSRKKRRKA